MVILTFILRIGPDFARLRRAPPADPPDPSGFEEWAVQDLNLRPPACKTDALPLS
jgi:hypothetical protein